MVSRRHLSHARRLLRQGAFRKSTELRRQIKKVAIPLRCLSNGPPSGCRQPSEWTRFDDDRIFLERSLPGADDLAIHHDDSGQGIPERPQPRADLRVTNGAVVFLTGNVLIINRQQVGGGRLILDGALRHGSRQPTSAAPSKPMLGRRAGTAAVRFRNWVRTGQLA